MMEEARFAPCRKSALEGIGALINQAAGEGTACTNPAAINNSAATSVPGAALCTPLTFLTPVEGKLSFYHKLQSILQDREQTHSKVKMRRINKRPHHAYKPSIKSLITHHDTHSHNSLSSDCLVTTTKKTTIRNHCILYKNYYRLNHRCYSVSSLLRRKYQHNASTIEGYFKLGN